MAAKGNIHALACFGVSILFCFIVFLPHLTDSATTDAATTEAATTVAATTVAPTTVVTNPPPTEAPSPIEVNTDIGRCTCDLTGNACDVNCCCDTECTDADKLAFSECLPMSVNVDDRQCIQSQLLLINNTPSFEAQTQDGLFCIYFDNNAERNFHTNPDLVNDGVIFQNYVNQFAGPSFKPAIQSRQYANEYKSGDPVYVVYENLASGYLGLPDTSGSAFCSDNNPAAFLVDQSTECVRPLTTLTQTDCENSLFWTAASYYQGFKLVVTPHLFNWIVNQTDTTTTSTTTVGTTAAVNVNSTTADVNATTASVATTLPTVTTGNISEVTTDNSTTSTVSVTSAELVVTTEDAFAVDLYNNSYVKSVTVDSVSCRDINGAVADCPANSPLAPSLAGAQCNNVVLGVEYILTYGTGTPGIMTTSQLLLDTIKVRLTMGSINANSLPLSQKFSVNFDAPVQQNVTLKSGNPGYIVGKPIRAGIKVQQTNLAIVEGNYDLTVIKSSAAGECLTDAVNRVQVNFGEDMRTGCLIKFNLASLNVTDYCSTMRAAIIDALEGLEDSINRENPAASSYNRYVAMLGNSDVLKTGDWVQVIRENYPLPATSTQNAVDGPSCTLSMGMNIQILYAYIGAKANPQAKIVGVSLTYDAPQVVTYRCIGVYCRTGASDLLQSFEISQSVTFIDITQPATGFAGEAPIFLAKVPYDFFYPFVRGSAQSLRYSYGLMTLILLFSFVVNCRL